MSISDQITRIKTNIANAYTSLESKGATIPADKNSNNLATTVDSISASAFPNKAFDVDSAGVATAIKGQFKSSDFSSLTKISDYAMYYKWTSLDASEYTDNVINFGNVTEIGSNGLSYAFYHAKIGTTSNPCVVNFDNLTTVGEKGLYSTFEGDSTSDEKRPKVLLSNNSFKNLISIGSEGMRSCFKECVVINDIISFNSLTSVGKYALSSFIRGYRAPNIKTLTFPALTTLKAEYSFSEFCKESKVRNVLFEELTSIEGSNIFYSAFQSCPLLENIQFPKLETVYGAQAFYYAFAGQLNFTAISFPSLTSVTGYDSFSCLCKGAIYLKTVSFPSLTSITGTSAFAFAITQVRSLKTVSFSSLTSIDGDHAFFYAFENCSSLPTISFPSLTTITNKNSFENCFSGCSKLTEIHFRADAQSTIEGLNQYATKFGATNATIYFDL